MDWLHIAGRDIGITPYAARRMVTRGIAMEDVRTVLARPTSLTPSRDSPARLVCRRSVRGRRLDVVIEVVSGESRWHVVTTWEEGQDG